MKVNGAETHGNGASSECNGRYKGSLRARRACAARVKRYRDKKAMVRLRIKQGNDEFLVALSKEQFRRIDQLMKAHLAPGVFGAYSVSYVKKGEQYSHVTLRFIPCGHEEKLTVVDQ